MRRWHRVLCLLRWPGKSGTIGSESTVIIMNHRVTQNHWVKRSFTAALVLYGLFCLIAQIAYLPSRRGGLHPLYIRMEGRYAVAFGASILLVVALGMARRLPGIRDQDLAVRIMQGVGIVIVVALAWYAVWGGSYVRWLAQPLHQ